MAAEGRTLRRGSAGAMTDAQISYRHGRARPGHPRLPFACGLHKKAWMPGIADKFTQSAQFRLLWPGMTRRVPPLLLPNAYDKIDVTEVRHGN